MNVILSLAFNGQNYGQLLQAYATQVMLDRMGCRTQIIDYHRSGFGGIRPTPWLACYVAARLGRRLKGKKTIAAMDETHLRNVKERKRAAEAFRQARLHDVVRVNGIQELNELGSGCDAAMVGSDQCWLPDSCFGNLRTLRFVPDGVRKISYATSLGVSSYPIYCRSSARQFLRRFDFISVREEQGRRIVESLCDKKVEVVLDPTYLLTREDWLELIPDEREIEGAYILAFFIGDNPHSKRAAADFARRAGLRLVSILSDESCSELDLTYADEVIAGAGPERFVNLIRNAACVLTDSFHGLAFSVINRRPFYAFYRHADAGSDSRNSRIDNILAQWSLQYRLVRGDNIPDDAVRDIDYGAVGAILERRRAESLDYLKRALT